MTRRLRLGYSVGAAESVYIPLGHMAVAGQTQMAGKTTTMEALIMRESLRALTFITKRGESAFRTGVTQIPPYFKEQADWQFVASILEASRGEKLKFERAWIMRASKGARTLADVQRNVRTLQAKSKRSMDQDMYMVLDAYLDVVVPEIARVDWSPALPSLNRGVNVMDLTRMPVEMQHLVIRSTVDYVLNHCEETVVVIPEAWKFLPEGRNTPVKRGVDALIRQGAALQNFVWIDSQDLGGVAKEILRHVPVWLLGVQREANEIKRTLANIPANIAAPKPAKIATLDLGFFYACWGREVVETYVQPLWLDDEHARLVARGEHNSDDDAIRRPPQEDTVSQEELRALRSENERLRNDNEDLRRRLVALESQAETGRTRAPEPAPRPAAPALRDGAEAPAHQPAGTPFKKFAAEPEAAFEDPDFEQEYQAIKARLLADALHDPGILRVLAAQPEIEVRLERKVIQIDGASLKGRLARLIADGYFREPRTQGAARSYLAKTGSLPNSGQISTLFKELVRDGFLMMDSSNTYVEVPSAKVNIIAA